MYPPKRDAYRQNSCYQNNSTTHRGPFHLHLHLPCLSYKCPSHILLLFEQTKPFFLNHHVFWQESKDIQSKWTLMLSNGPKHWLTICKGCAFSDLMVSAAITQLHRTCSDKRAGACLCCERQSGGWPQKPCHEWWLRGCPADVWLSRGNPEHRDTIRTGQQSTLNKSGTRSVNYDWKNKRYPKLPNVFYSNRSRWQNAFQCYLFVLCGRFLCTFST